MKFITIVITVVCYGYSFVYTNLLENIEGQDSVPQGESGIRSGASPTPDPDYAPDQYLVKFTTGANELNCDEEMEASGSEVIEKIVTATMIESGDVEGVTLMKTVLNVPDAIEIMLRCEAVEYAEPNYIYTSVATSNDPYVTDGSLWGMCSSTATGGGVANQFGIGATTMWQNGNIDCGDVYVGIIDEGFMFTHEDLVENAGTNPGEIPDDGLDNDGNGYIDDVNGWDFWNDDNTVYDPVDGDEHGTHVAGTIGGVGGNGEGVAGVCWNVKLLSAKFLGPFGGYTSDAIKAVDYITDLKKKGLNIVATNNSWGGGGYSQALFDAIQRANDAGILFVAAAGNAGLDNDVTPHYPSSYTNDNIIAVASITSTGGLSWFSNYGVTSVDIGAPGDEIWSTVPGGYDLKSGTSMATPHVTGAAALYKAMYPAATAAGIKAAILAGATPTTSLNGKVATGGRVNIAELTPSPTTSPTTQSPTTSSPTTSSPTTSSPTTSSPTGTPTTAKPQQGKSRKPSRQPIRKPSRKPNTAKPQQEGKARKPSRQPSRQSTTPKPQQEGKARKPSRQPTPAKPQQGFFG